MKSQKLFLATFLSCCCTLSYAQEPSKQICDKGNFPAPTNPPQEAVIPPFEDGDTSGDGSGGSTTDPSATPSKPQGDKEYFPQSSAPATPKGDKEYFPQSTAPTTPITPKAEKDYYPSASSNQNKSNTKKASR